MRGLELGDAGSASVPLLTPFLPGRVLAETASNTMLSRLVQRATHSKWTHVSLVVNETTLIESVFPGGVRELLIVDALKELAGREWALLDMDATRGEDVVVEARKFGGFLYDFRQPLRLPWGMFGGPLRMVCSSLVARAYLGAQLLLFSGVAPTGVSAKRWQQMLLGYCTPAELVEHSALKIVHHVNPSKAV